ncbi:MAG: hypothetical protein JXA24_04065 [Proteobacteria bacterium]|nr:hypothetical protein [Pseudomonadota bacterium]
MDEKERIEREALTFFLRLYNRKKGTKYRFLRKRERPDFEIVERASRKVVGVEVSHIFHDKKEAMMFMGRDPSTVHGIISAEDNVKVLVDILRKKAEKVRHYPYRGPIILVIRDYSQTFDLRTLFGFKMGLKVPRSDYREVWYLSRSRPVKRWDELVRLR